MTNRGGDFIRKEKHTEKNLDGEKCGLGLQKSGEASDDKQNVERIFSFIFLDGKGRFQVKMFNPALKSGSEVGLLRTSHNLVIRGKLGKEGWFVP